MKNTLLIILTPFIFFFSSFSFAEQQGIEEGVLRNLFQELKTYMGLLQGNEREHQNVLRAVPPPDYELSATIGENIKAQIPNVEFYENSLIAGSIAWNMLLPQDEVTNSKFVMRHLSGFCSDLEREAGFCNKGLALEQGGAADILASSLLGQASITDVSGVTDFIYNLSNATPIPLPNNAFASDNYVNVAPAENTPMAGIHGAQVGVRELTSSGIRTLAARYKQMALLSTAQYALDQILAERRTVEKLGSNIGLTKENISVFEALKYEATRRFTDENWHADLYELPDTAILREIANMQAVQLALDFKRYEQEQTMMTLLAAQVSNAAQTYGAAETAAQMQ